MYSQDHEIILRKIDVLTLNATELGYHVTRVYLNPSDYLTLCKHWRRHDFSLHGVHTAEYIHIRYIAAIGEVVIVPTNESTFDNLIDIDGIYFESDYINFIAERDLLH